MEKPGLDQGVMRSSLNISDVLDKECSISTHVKWGTLRGQATAYSFNFSTSESDSNVKTSRQVTPEDTVIDE